MGIFISKNKIEGKFWDWFLKNEDEIFHFENNQEHVFKELGRALSKVNKYLTFEFGPITDGNREFVISADGIKEAFPGVESLHAKAPKLSNWTFTKFRPRRSPMDLQFGELYIKPSDVLVSLTRRGAIIDLVLFIKGAGGENDQQYNMAAYIVLDQSIGEYDMETKVGSIQVKPYDYHSNVDKVTLNDLPIVFDSML